MKATILRNGTLHVETLPDLTPGPEQVLLRPLACGICGSDLHTVHHAHEFKAAVEQSGTAGFLADFDPDRDVVMGHEFSGRVLAVGSAVEGIEVGAVYASMPFVTAPEGQFTTGYSNTYPGAYSDQMLVSPHALLPIPNGLDPRIAALTEPMAVGLQAVNESGITPGRAALVVGAGPVGLAITAALKARGIEAIVVSDFSSKRREVASQMGASVVIDPAQQDLIETWRDVRVENAPPVLFDAVGVSGIIDSLMAQAPERSDVVVAGLCMTPDTIRPSIGIYKRLSLRFVLGWTPEEFAQCLRDLAEGRLDGAPMITGEVGLDDTPQAFKDLADPERHVKILVRPEL